MLRLARGRGGQDRRLIKEAVKMFCLISVMLSVYMVLYVEKEERSVPRGAYSLNIDTRGTTVEGMEVGKHM